MTTDNGKPRGKCTGQGCGFEYQLGTARSGDFKGQLVIRKHNSRVGPGLCDGAQKPPAIELGEATGDEQAFADPAPVAEQREGVPPVFHASYDSAGSCGHPISESDLIQSDGADGYVCSDCIVEPEGNWAVAPQPSATARMQEAGERVTEIPGGHDYTNDLGDTWRHGGTLEQCTTPERIGYRNRISPPPVSTPVTHQCERGLYTDVRNCPEHGEPTPSTLVGVKLTGTVAPAVAGHLNGVPVSPTHYDHGARELHQGTREKCARCAYGVTPPGLPAEIADPAPAPQELPPVSGQPEPDRDRWGRYVIEGKSHTRATTFAKLGSSTFALGEWNERMLIKGLTERRDLLAMAHGMDVKANRAELNKIADQAQEHAGNKVAANIGTAYHTFTEQLDAGLTTLADVPEEWRARCAQYVDALASYGLRTCGEWIERTTAVRADQVSAPIPVAGTLDRIFELPNGDLVIGDLKTSSNIEYGWAEIAVQLALYAHGVNTHGLFDWNTKTWQQLSRAVRTDYAVVMHLPADGDGCHLYRVDLEKGWWYAQVSGLVQSRQKDKSVATPLTPQEIPAAPAPQQYGPVDSEQLTRALTLVREAGVPEQLNQLYRFAVESGRFTEDDLSRVKAACAERWAALSA